MLNFFSRHRLFSSAALLSSNVFSNAILFLGVYVISKLVTPATLGQASAFLAVSLAVYPFFTMRYELAIPVAKSDRTARTLAVLCIGLSAVGALLTSSSVLLFGKCCVAPGLITPQALSLLPLVGPAAFALALMAIMQMVATRSSDIGRLAVSRTIRAILVVVFQSMFVLLLARTAFSMIIGEIAANLVGALILILGAANQNWRLRNVHLRQLMTQLFAVAKRNKQFAIVSLPHAVSHQALTAIYGISVGMFYGATAMGHYFLMRRIIFGTIGSLSTAIYQACLADASKAKGDVATMKGLVLYVILTVGMVTIPLALLIRLFGESVFTTIFGSQWAIAGILAGAAFTLIVLEPIASTLSFVPVFMKRQTHAFMWSLTQNAVGILSFAAIHYAGGALVYAIMGSSLAVTVVMIGFVLWVRALCTAPLANRGVCS